MNLNLLILDSKSNLALKDRKIERFMYIGNNLS